MAFSSGYALFIVGTTHYANRIEQYDIPKADAIQDIYSSPQRFREHREKRAPATPS
jgi:hypothetical protein